MSMMPTCLITGINGFAGSYLAETLLKKGYLVSGIDRGDSFSNLSHISAKLKLFTGDILDKEKMSEIMEVVKPDYVFHLAAQPSVAVSFKEPKLTHEVNVKGTQNILDAAREHVPNVRILLTCTADEYGAVKEAELPIKETHPLAPTSPYAESKKEVEELARLYHTKYSTQVIITRSFNHAGPRQSPDFVLSNWAKQVAEIEAGRKEPVLLVGNLEAKRDFLDVRDVIEAYIILITKGEPGEVYNVCSGKAYSLQDYLNDLIALSSKKIEVRIDPKKLRPIDNPVYCGDNTKLERLGWKQEIALNDMLKHLLEYWRKL